MIVAALTLCKPTTSHLFTRSWGQLVRHEQLTLWHNRKWPVATTPVVADRAAFLTTKYMFVTLQSIVCIPWGQLRSASCCHFDVLMRLQTSRTHTRRHVDAREERESSDGLPHKTRVGGPTVW